ncbi:MAG: CoA-transferase [Gemmatimonadales bacterium]
MACRRRAIFALHDLGVTGLTVVSNNAGTSKHGLVHLLHTRQIKKMMSSYVGENDVFEKQMLSASRGRADPPGHPLGADPRRGSGILAFYTPTGVGTPIAKGKETREFDGRTGRWERGSSASTPWSKRTRATPRATWSTGRRRGTSTR